MIRLLPEYRVPKCLTRLDSESTWVFLAQKKSWDFFLPRLVSLWTCLGLLFHVLPPTPAQDISRVMVQSRSASFHDLIARQCLSRVPTAVPSSRMLLMTLAFSSLRWALPPTLLMLDLCPPSCQIQLFIFLLLPAQSPYTAHTSVRVDTISYVRKTWVEKKLVVNTSSIVHAF